MIHVILSNNTVAIRIATHAILELDLSICKVFTLPTVILNKTKLHLKINMLVTKD